MYLFESAEGIPPPPSDKGRGKGKGRHALLKHDFKKVSGLRKLVNLLIQEAKDATAKKINREIAIENALRPLTSDKVKLGALKRFAKGDTLQCKQYSALFSVIGGMIKDDVVPLVWRNDVPADPQKNFYSMKPANEDIPQATATSEGPVILDTDDDWLKRAILANAARP